MRLEPYFKLLQDLCWRIAKQAEEPKCYGMPIINIRRIIGLAVQAERHSEFSKI